jgi:hypothetical protein
MGLHWRRYTPVRYLQTKNGSWYSPYPDDRWETKTSFVRARKLSQPEPYTGVRFIWQHLPNGNWRVIEAPMSRKAFQRLRARQFQLERRLHNLSERC